MSLARRVRAALTPLNPWRRIAQLERALEARDRDFASLQRHADLIADRYEKMRLLNAELRRGMDLYRNGAL